MARRTPLRSIVRQKIAMPAALKTSQISRRLPNDLKDTMQACALFAGKTQKHVASDEAMATGLAAAVKPGRNRQPPFTCLHPLAFTFNRHACNSGSV